MENPPQSVDKVRPNKKPSLNRKK